MHLTFGNGYCLLGWMFHIRKLSNLLNSIHEHDLRIVFEDYELIFKQFLKQNGSLSINQRNLQTFVTKILKIKNDLNPVTMRDAFHFKNLTFNFQNAKKFSRSNVNVVKYGTYFLK